MTVVVPGRGAKQEGQQFDPRRISPSRINSLVSCGIAFRMKYLEGLPSEQSGSAALFGSVIHLALERWTMNAVVPETGELLAGRSQNLLTLMRQAWLDFGDEKAPVISEFVREYQTLSTAAIRLEHEIKERRPDIKKVRMTKDWKQSGVAKAIDALTSKWYRRLNEESYYRFSEYDPLPDLYDESLLIAKRYEARWSHLPPAYHAELGFEEPWRGFTLHGYIDSIEPLHDRDTGEMVGLGVIDYKTYAKPPAEHKDWRQVVMYDVAVRSMIERGVFPPAPDGLPLYVGVDYVRWNDGWVGKDGKPFPARKFWQVGDADYERLERELTSYLNTVESGSFLPAEKGRNPDFCDFPSACCLRNCVGAGGDTKTVEVNL